MKDKNLPSVPRKKAYSSPLLKVYGKVTKLTKLGKQGSEFDNGEFTYSPD